MEYQRLKALRRLKWANRCVTRLNARATVPSEDKNEQQVRPTFKRIIKNEASLWHYTSESCSAGTHLPRPLISRALGSNSARTETRNNNLESRELNERSKEHASTSDQRTFSRHVITLRGLTHTENTRTWSQSTRSVNSRTVNAWLTARSPTLKSPLEPYGGTRPLRRKTKLTFFSLSTRSKPNGPRFILPFFAPVHLMCAHLLLN